MSELSLNSYAEIIGSEAIEHLHQLARYLKGIDVLHINSTKTGGGVAEILTRLVPLMNELGIVTVWEVIEGNEEFFTVTKTFHNALQGYDLQLTKRMREVYEQVLAENAVKLRDRILEADIIFIHDPQPLAIIQHFPFRRGKWVWRCHIDLSRPCRPFWKYLRNYAVRYDASVFHLADFVQRLPHPIYLIPPSIDPLSEKNMELSEEEIDEVYRRFNIDRDRPVLLQVSRFDRFKDPLGVIRAYRLAKSFFPSIQLVLAGGGATDDPEGEAIFKQVLQEAEGDPDLHVLYLPPDNRTINALQRGATIVLQKSIKEGFGLTVSEAMWKGKPVIGGNVGGIRLQITDGVTGYLVYTPEGAAFRIRYLLSYPDKMREMGQRAREVVRHNFLITRHLRDYLVLIMSLTHGIYDRIELT